MDDLRYHLESDPERHRHRIRCLTEVTGRTRESLRARERQTNELKDQLAQLLVRLGDRSFLEARDDAGAECGRQLENVNALKTLYNERLRVFTELREAAVKELTDTRQKLEYSLKKSENLEEELKKAEEKVRERCDVFNFADRISRRVLWTARSTLKPRRSRIWSRNWA